MAFCRYEPTRAEAKPLLSAALLTPAPTKAAPKSRPAAISAPACTAWVEDCNDVVRVRLAPFGELVDSWAAPGCRRAARRCRRRCQSRSPGRCFCLWTCRRCRCNPTGTAPATGRRNSRRQRWPRGCLLTLHRCTARACPRGTTGGRSRLALLAMSDMYVLWSRPAHLTYSSPASWAASSGPGLLDPLYPVGRVLLVRGARRRGGV